MQRGDAGALRATNNRGLQPAMDFILEHNDDPIPDATSAAAAASSAQPPHEPMDEDEDEDTVALRAAYGLKPGAVSQTDSAAGVEARVSSRPSFAADYSHILLPVRVLNVHSAGRYSKIRHSPTSTQRRVGTISSRSQSKRCVYLTRFTRVASTYETL
jgi:hypothetical protein